MGTEWGYETPRQFTGGGVRLGFEPVDEPLEDGLERGIVVVGVVADDGDGAAVVVGGLAMIAAGFADHAEAVVAVMDIGEAPSRSRAAWSAASRLPVAQTADLIIFIPII